MKACLCLVGVALWAGKQSSVSFSVHGLVMVSISKTQLSKVISTWWHLCLLMNLRFKKPVVDSVSEVQYAGEVLPCAWLTNHLLLIIHDQSATERMPNKAGYLLTTGNYNHPVCLEKLYPSNRIAHHKRRNTVCIDSILINSVYREFKFHFVTASRTLNVTSFV